MKKIFASLILAFLFQGTVHTQQLSDMTNLPVTPQASAILKNIAAPVSYYTGQPNVSLPIYTISQDGVNVPISISFNTSGIYVTEESTSLGIGVRLNWGGSIVRSANGRPDEKGFFFETYRIGSLKQELAKDYSNTSTTYLYPYNGYPGSFAEVTDREQEYKAINTYSDPYALGSGGISTDLRPDNFYYDVLGSSGLFKFNQADAKFVTFPLDDIKINKTLSGGKIQNFEIIKNDGVKIVFGDGAVESSMKYNTNVNTNYNQVIDQSWFIKKITTLKNTTIDFSYIDNKYDHSTDDRTFTYVPYKAYTNNSDLYVVGDAYSTVEKLIKTISFKEGRIEFIYANDRADFPLSQTNGTQPSPRLNQIVLFDGNNTVIKTFRFYQSYFIGNSSDGYTGSLYNDRLRLDSLTVEDNNLQVLEKYKFDYNSNTTIPSKRPLKRDWWGYYNANSNNKYINSSVNQIFTIKKITFPTGGERTFTFEDNQVPWNNQYMAKLRELSNDWFDAYSSNNLIINGSTLYDPFGSSNQTSSGAPVLSGTPPYNNVRTIYGDEFTIQGQTNTTAEGISLSGYTTFIHPEITLSQLNQWAYKIEIGLQEKAGTVFNDVPYTVTIDRYRTSPAILPTNNFQLTIPSLTNGGTYRIFVRMTSPPNYVITTNYSQHTNAVLTYKKNNFHNIKVGGLRIKEIADNDGYNNYKTFYEYTDAGNYGSGKLVTAPEYKEYVIQKYPNGTPEQNTFYYGYRISSEPIFPLLKTQGSYVGYTNVRKIQIGENETIKEEFIFSFNPSTRSGYMKEYFQETEPKPWQNGKLLVNKKYKGAEVISETIFDYYGLTNETDKGYTEEINTGLTEAGKTAYDLSIDRRYDNPVTIGSPPVKVFQPLYGSDNRTTYYDGTFTRLLSPFTKIPYFKTYSGFDKLKSKTTKNYSNGNEITHVENYYYDGLPTSLGMSRIEAVNSQNQTIVSKFYYPQDLAAEPNMTQMIDANRIATPVRKEQFINGTKLFEEKLIYFQDPLTSLLLPRSVYSSSFPNNNPVISNPSVGQLELQVSYDQFDSYGNLVQYHEGSNTPVTLIWGYNHTYLVAKVVNANYSTIASLINQSVLDNGASTNQQIKDELNKIRTGLDGLRALVTTYTYKPLVGITSETDPTGRTVYYEYDTFNRLKLQKDEQGNILKKYCYNYAGQPVNCN